MPSGPLHGKHCGAARWRACCSAGVAVLAVACAQRVPPPAMPATPTAPATPATTATAPVDAQALRERMRGIAKTHCGACHQSSRPSAKPAALAIFDLDAADWPSTLTAARLEGGFRRRLDRRLDDAGRQQLHAFIANEVALRAK
jgi:mono/diheme cytochrome c family protein